jgi:hypothetical protein
MCRKFTTLLQYPVPISNTLVATGCHSKFINSVSRWRFAPSSNYEMLNDVRVDGLLLRLSGLLCYIYTLCELVLDLILKVI